MIQTIILAEIAIGYDVTVWMVQGTDNRRRTYYEETILLNGEEVSRVTYKKAVAAEWIAKNKALAADHLLDLAQDAANRAAAKAERKAANAAKPVQLALIF